MAVTTETSPTFIQANTFSAEETRRGIMWALQRGASIGSVAGGLVGALAGVPDLQVTWSGSGLTVGIAAGEVIVPGSSSTSQSGYKLSVPSAGTLTPATANGSNPRIDLIYAQVEDAAYTGSSNLGQVAIATGTPTNGATLANLTGAPAVPTSAIAIAYVLIPAGASTISNSDILNEYTMAYFGPNIFNASPTATSGTASSGQHVIVSANSPTITLPVPFKNARVKVTNYGSGVTTVSQHSAEVIYGEGCTSSGVSSFLLGTYGATATVESDGTNWFITAGMQDTGWLPFASFPNGSSNSADAAMRKTGNVVRARGIISVGLAGSACATYPSSGGSWAFGGTQSAINNIAPGTTTTAWIVQWTSTGITPYQLVGSPTLLGLNGLTYTVD